MRGALPKSRLWTVDSEIGASVRSAVRELLQMAPSASSEVLVVGCSTSEVQGRPIGKHTSVEVAEEILEALLLECTDGSLAIQCCEHLNRALVVESEVACGRGWTEVRAYPIPGAGGALGYSAMRRFNHPVLVERVEVGLGIDIGQTLIGMHLRPVAVPVRLGVRRVGQAIVTAAFSRPKLIGGARAVYQAPKELS